MPITPPDWHAADKAYQLHHINCPHAAPLALPLVQGSGAQMALLFDFRAHQLGIAQAVHAHSDKACAGEAGEAALRHQPLPSLKRLAPIQAVVKPDIRLCRVFIRPAPALACVVVRAVVVHRRDVDSVVGGGDKPGHGGGLGVGLAGQTTWPSRRTGAGLADVIRMGGVRLPSRPGRQLL